MSESVEYEWKAMSEWLAENKGKNRMPSDDGWEFELGALRRPVSRRASDQQTRGKQ